MVLSLLTDYQAACHAFLAGEEGNDVMMQNPVVRGDAVGRQPHVSILGEKLPNTGVPWVP